MQEVLLADPQIDVELLAFLFRRVEGDHELVIIIVIGRLVAAHKLLELLRAKACVPALEALLLEHLLDSLLEGGEPLPLLPDDVLVEVLEPLVDSGLNCCLIIFCHLDSLTYSLA